MHFQRIRALVLKDLKLFALDRQAVVLSLLVPVMIASILGWMDVSSSSSDNHKAIPFEIADNDGSALSKAIIARLAKNDSVKAVPVTEAQAKKDVAEGNVAAVVILPAGMGKDAGGAFSGGTKPKIQLLDDPSQPMESQIVKGAVMEASSQEIAAVNFGALANIDSAPLDLHEEPAASGGKATKWASAAHDFAGFGMQGLLFFAMEVAVGLTRERRQAMWLRVRSSPLPPGDILLSKGFSSTFVALAIVVAMFAIGAGLFGIRVLGSAAGFASICAATALAAATFGLMIATLCKTEAQSRGIAFLLIMVMLATGGAWFPLAKMPAFVQTLANFMPVRWAVDGFDAMTWRGEGLAHGLQTAGVLLLFSLAFSIVASVRFRMLAYRD